MDEKIEAQDVLRETVRKVTSTKRALGNSEHESHERIDGMMRYIHDFLGDSMDVEHQVRRQYCSPVPCAYSSSRGCASVGTRPLEAGSTWILLT